MSALYIMHCRETRKQKKSLFLVMMNEASDYIGLALPLNELPVNVSFESVLPKSHVDTLMQLAGCSGAQTRDPCDDQCFHSRYRLPYIKIRGR